MTAETFKRSSRGRTPTGQPNPIDVHVGNRIRLRRTLLGLSQEKMASLLGLTFQQVQKYEKGMNRVGASRLFRACRRRHCPRDSETRIRLRRIQKTADAEKTRKGGAASACLYACFKAGCRRNRTA